MLGKTGEYEHSVSCGSSPNYQEAVATAQDKNWADQPGSPISAATWHHVATTWDAQTVYQYIDGVEVKSRALTGSLSSTAVFGVASGVGIGCGNVVASGATGSDAYWFVGAIDEVALYDRALSATEIQDYYAATKSCAADLSNVGTADFHISFTLTTTASFPTGTSMALASQRVGCDQTSTFWDITMNNAGGIVAATDDGLSSHYTFVEAGNAVNDGKPHSIVVARVGGKLWYSRDGVVGSALADDAYSLGGMPALAVGTDPCSGTVPLVGSGTLTDLCITTP